MNLCAQDCHNPEEPALVESRPEMYIRGPITQVNIIIQFKKLTKVDNSFITTNPGQQLLTGSFQPIEVGDWAREAYEYQAVGEACESEVALSETASEYTDAASSFSIQTS